MPSNAPEAAAAGNGFAPSADAAGHVDEAFVTFGLDGGIAAISVRYVREVLDSVQLSPIPSAPHDVLGIIDVRGQSVAVLSLRAKFGLPPADLDDQSRILILEIETIGGSLTLGVLTDCVFEVTHLTEGPLEAPPRLGTRWDSRFIAGVARRHGRFVVVLEVDEVFTESELLTARDPFAGFDVGDDDYAGRD